MSGHQGLLRDATPPWSFSSCPGSMRDQLKTAGFQRFGTKSVPNRMHSSLSSCLVASSCGGRGSCKLKTKYSGTRKFTLLSMYSAFSWQKHLCIPSPLRRTPASRTPTCWGVDTWSTALFCSASIPSAPRCCLDKVTRATFASTESWYFLSQT